MQLPLQIAVRNLELGPGHAAQIRRRARKLGSFHPRITGCRVLAETPHRRHREGGQFRVRIDLTLPGGELVIKQQHATDLLTAIQEAFDAAQRRLEDYNRVQRGAVKRPARPARGQVARIFPRLGYGFLTTADGREVYFHRNAVLREAFDRLDVGSDVRFAEEAGDEGPQASSIALARRRG